MREEDPSKKWTSWIEKLLDWLTRKYSAPRPSVRLLDADTFSDFDKGFEKDPRLYDARGVFDPEWETNGVSDPTIFITIGDARFGRVHSMTRIMSILFHEYHHYLDWLRPTKEELPEQIPALPYELLPKSEEKLPRKEQWIWYRAQKDMGEFVAVMKTSASSGYQK